MSDLRDKVRKSAFDVHKFLSELEYPIRKSEIIDIAVSMDLDEYLIGKLDHIPDIEYTGVSDLSEALGDAELF